LAAWMVGQWGESSAVKKAVLMVAPSAARRAVMWERWWADQTVA
jgi:hypothetical protein